jgi:predicted O-methyltransferase YrrM
MQFDEFYERFGGSVRTKKVADPAKPSDGRKRPYPVPGSSPLPKNLVRLCPWEVEYLFAVARRASHGILETGRFSGGSTFVMACAAKPGVPIYSIDIAPQDDAAARRYLSEYVPDANVELIVGDSQRGKFPQIGPVDLLFIDGDHSYDGCMRDIENWYDHLLPNGHLVFHDSYLGRHGVQDAILDFMDRHRELQVIQSPVIGPSYWQYPAGSIAHLIRRG